MDYDCSGEESREERRSRGRARASDLWSQPKEVGGGVGEEGAAGEEVGEAEVQSLQ